MVERVDADAVENYGIAELNAESITPFSSVKVKGLVEKPPPSRAPSNLAILGRYVLPFRVLDLLEHTYPGVGGEIQLTDALDELLESQGLNAVETDAQIFDCGSKQGFLSANLAVGMRDHETKRIIETLFDESAV
jgi:UTP--glucose-1-phosphate uridylyltransferase